MGLIILYFLGALSLSFLCSVLEAVLLSTPMSFISMKENQGNKTASLMKQYKNNVDRPVGAILSLNTIAHTIGSAGVGAESMKLFGEEYFGIISAILTLLILVLSEIIPKTIGASYWRSLAMTSTKIIRVLIFITYPLVLLSELITKVFTPKNHQRSEEHTSELQSRFDLVCRLLLEKKKKKKHKKQKKKTNKHKTYITNKALDRND